MIEVQGESNATDLEQLAKASMNAITHERKTKIKKDK